MKEDKPIFKSTISLEKRNTLETDGNDDVELKISKQDEFGNTYFEKQVVNQSFLNQEIAWRQDALSRLTDEITELQEKLNLIK